MAPALSPAWKAAVLTAIKKNKVRGTIMRIDTPLSPLNVEPSPDVFSFRIFLSRAPATHDNPKHEPTLSR